MTDKPSVLLGCVHNASRSQIATGFSTELSAGGIEIRWAGSPPVDQVNPASVQAMAEVGIDITAEVSKLLTTDAIRASDVVITMPTPGHTSRTTPDKTRTPGK